ncbi:hypothetical protein [Streptomyces telluris]|uniref:Uncharacterized protein n=1 Tax=Streptomyces telluris TaxID=2720021 RepID=A0A9X2RR84_9ACTN|nr:hypothetical protein [Streptomyces telluris]MCQ8773100.1 hypothetical protein [Streptomyces telluris]
MGTYISVRGWLECDDKQLAAIQEIISAHEDDHYSNGWSTPRRHINWTHYLFYGADVRESALDWFTDQITEIAQIPDTDGYLVRGLFLATHEVTGTMEWQIRNGQLFASPAGTSYQYLTE